MPFVLLKPFWNNHCLFLFSIYDVNIWWLNSNLPWRGGWAEYTPCINILKWLCFWYILQRLEVVSCLQFLQRFGILGLMALLKDVSSFKINRLLISGLSFDNLFIFALTFNADDLLVEICAFYQVFYMQVSSVLFKLFWKYHRLLIFLFMT